MVWFHGNAWHDDRHRRGRRQCRLRVIASLHFWNIALDIIGESPSTVTTAMVQLLLPQLSWSESYRNITITQDITTIHNLITLTESHCHSNHWPFQGLEFIATFHRCHRCFTPSLHLQCQATSLGQVTFAPLQELELQERRWTAEPELRWRSSLRLGG